MLDQTQQVKGIWMLWIDVENPSIKLFGFGHAAGTVMPDG
jgi:hypothetical protein